MLDTVSKNNNNGHSAYFSEVCGTDHLNGLSVRLTCTMSAVGSLAALFITDTGLMEREVHVSICLSGIVRMLIEVLCLGGG